MQWPLNSAKALFQVRPYIKKYLQANHNQQHRCQLSQNYRQSTTKDYYQVHEDNSTVRLCHLGF